MSIQNRISDIKKGIATAEKQLTNVVLTKDSDLIQDCPFKSQTKSEMIASLNRIIDAGYRNISDLIVNGEDDNLGIG